VLSVFDLVVVSECLRPVLEVERLVIFRVIRLARDRRIESAVWGRKEVNALRRLCCEEIEKSHAVT